MTITLTGCKLTPKWETLQEAIREATGIDGRLTRIYRPDGSCDYRAKGNYDLTFRPYGEGEAIAIRLTIA